MSTNSKIAGARALWLERQAEAFDNHLGWCESPIEKLLLATLVSYSHWRFWPDGYCNDYHRAEDRLNAEGVLRQFPRGLLFHDSSPDFMAAQQSLVVSGRTMRLDFAAFAYEDKFAIELDGHDFHERTKEQAPRDRSRDRDLTLAGWKVLRFTGSEVHADPEAVVEPIEEAMMASFDRGYERHLAAREGRSP